MAQISSLRDALSRFAQDETAAVTIDWVVLAAAVVGLVTAIFITLGNDTSDYAKDIQSVMTARGIMTSY